jgi:hypothetical protein
LPIILKEIHVEDPLPARRLEVWRQKKDRRERVMGAASHTILKFTSSLRSSGHTGAHASFELVADSTHRQYWFEKGIETYSDYMQHKTRSKVGVVTEDKFGTQYGRFKAEFENMVEEEESNHFMFLAEAMQRTTDNAVYAELKRIGGRDSLLSLGSEDLIAAQESILKALRKNLLKLRGALEVVGWYTESEHEHEKYLEILEEANGEGYQIYQEALDQLLDS